ncbi:MAG TPA: hypothetical protein VHC68_02635 [Candidatus Paceibacterota bacterium]|nr:hypothetical protein [Candidatus Paceibacterota bacterium]
MNTPTKGSVRCIVFREGEEWYGVALEFNIVVEGDDFDVVMFELQEAIRGYIEAEKKVAGSNTHEPLNQKPDDEYEQLWQMLQESKPVPSPYQVKYYGVAAI